MRLECFPECKTMTRTTRALLLTAGLLAPAAQAADPMLFREYFGAGASLRQLKGACQNATAANGFSGICDDSNTGAKVLGGYRLSRNTGIELAYDTFGQATAAGTLNGTPVDGKLRGSGVSLSFVGWLPVGDTWDIGLKVGAMRWEVRRERYLSQTPELRDTGFNLAAGIAATWYFAPQTGLRLDVDRLFSVGDAKTVGQFDVNAVTLGLVLRF